MNNNFDCIVIGAGHAGCEAALACARLGSRTLVLATNLDTVAYCACNPSIGGTAKGQIVREIDALGGQMALCADDSMLQIKMLNRGKGPAVHSPRAQVDKYAYHSNMKKVLENTTNLTLRQGEATSIEVNQGIFSVTTAVGLVYTAKTVIVATGVYLKSKIIIGDYNVSSGPNGFASAQQLSASLQKLGFRLRRFKTGTPARINANSIDFTKTEEQQGEEMSPFSFLNSSVTNKTVCHLTYSTAQTKKVILDNIHLAPIFTGAIEGTGPRYCPSIEDKVVRFADKERHQIFLEPEGDNTDEVYVQGVSSSLPASVQYEIYRTISGLENVQIMRDAYAIEYDCIDATTLLPTLMSKDIEGLFFAGQINGTSGYEEAAAQGIIAGINAHRFMNNLTAFTLNRQSSYIGVLIDDVTGKRTDEPYRMMTSRAEYRLLLRQDNADTRLTAMGREIGLVNDERWEQFCAKQQKIRTIEEQLNKIIKPSTINDYLTALGESKVDKGVTLSELLKRNSVRAESLFAYLNMFVGYGNDVFEQIEINAKYEGYIQKQYEQIEQQNKAEHVKLSPDIDYLAIKGLRIEAAQKLASIRPSTLGQAERISGVSPADITVLLVYLSKGNK